MPLFVANFVDTPLVALERKGNLAHALALYNPMAVADRVLHFTIEPQDVRLQPLFDSRRVQIVPFFDRGAPRWRQVLSLPVAFARIVRALRRARVSVVRGRLPYFSSLLGCLGARLLGIPSVVSLGGDNRLAQALQHRYYFGSRALSYGVERWVLTLADRVIVPNQFTRRYVEQVIGPARAEARTRVIPWIIDAAPSVPATDEQLHALAIPVDRPFVLVVGHLNSYKFAREMFDAAARLEQRRPGGVTVVFCGDGPLKDEALAHATRVPGMRIAGWQPNAVVRALMTRAACIAVPMSGFVLLEAAAAARPVVAGDIEWHGEIIENGQTGWLVPPKDAAAWAERIAWVLDHPREADAAGRHLGERFASAYAPERGLALEASLYKELAETGGAR